MKTIIFYGDGRVLRQSVFDRDLIPTAVGFGCEARIDGQLYRLTGIRWDHDRREIWVFCQPLCDAHRANTPGTPSEPDRTCIY